MEEEIRVLKLPGWARDHVAAGGVLLLTHQCGIHAVAYQVVPVVQFPRPRTDEGIITAWKEARDEP